VSLAYVRRQCSPQKHNKTTTKKPKSHCQIVSNIRSLLHVGCGFISFHDSVSLSLLKSCCTSWGSLLSSCNPDKSHYDTLWTWHAKFCSPTS